MSTTAATPAPTAQFANLADKLSAMAEKSKPKSSKPKARLEVTDDQEEVCFVISKQRLLESVGPSSTGTSDGVVLEIDGTFPFTLPNGQTVNLHIQMKGGWAGVKVARS